MLTEAHARLKADRINICRVANVPVTMLEKSATEYCKDPELQYLRKYPRYQREGKGLLLTGLHKPGADTKMQAMTCTFLRNFIDARVLTVQHLLDEHEEAGIFPDPTVLLIPNLFVVQTGKALTAWMTQLLYDLLLSRHVAGRMTIAYVEDMDGLGKVYGSYFKQHLAEHYIEAKG